MRGKYGCSLQYINKTVRLSHRNGQFDFGKIGPFQPSLKTHTLPNLSPLELEFSWRKSRKWCWTMMPPGGWITYLGWNSKFNTEFTSWIVDLWEECTDVDNSGIAIGGMFEVSAYNFWTIATNLANQWILHHSALWRAENLCNSEIRCQHLKCAPYMAGLTTKVMTW